VQNLRPAKINHVIGAPHCSSSCSDDEHGIASRAKFFQRGKKLLVVAGVANRWSVRPKRKERR